MSWLIVIPFLFIVLIILGITYIYVECRDCDSDLPTIRELLIKEREEYKVQKDKEAHRKWNSFLF